MVAAGNTFLVCVKCNCKYYRLSICVWDLTAVAYYVSKTNIQSRKVELCSFNFVILYMTRHLYYLQRRRLVIGLLVNSL